MSSNYSDTDLQSDASSKRQKAALVLKLRFLGQMSSTETALYHHKAAAKLGLSVTDIKAVSVLGQEGPQTAGSLSRRLHLTSGAVTALVDRLEKVGWARRVADPLDRRKTIVEIVPGKSDQPNIYDSMSRSVEKVFNQYSVQELQFLLQHAERQISVVRDEIAKLDE